MTDSAETELLRRRFSENNGKIIPTLSEMRNHKKF